MSAARYKRDDAPALHAWDSLYISLIPLPAALLGAALTSDGLYWLTASALCARASEWLLGAGLATGAIAASEGLIRYIGAGCMRPSRACWMHVVGNVLALLLSASNLIYRLNQDAADPVLPVGISLTVIVVCLLAATAYLGRGLMPEESVDDVEEWDFL
jgi:uncharacterized membrane protein